MDELGLAVLQAEVNEDLRIAADVARLVRKRLGKGSDPELEACAYQLARLYNVIEQMALRAGKAFENRIDDDSGWHVELIRRMSLGIPGVRPPLFNAEIVPYLQELRAFRHVVRHAYDLTLKKEKLAPVLEAQEKVSQSLPAICDAFFQQVKAQISNA